MPTGILRNLPVSSPPQEQVRKSLVNPNLQIPKTLPPLELPPPEKRETIDTYRPPDESLQKTFASSERFQRIGYVY